MLYPNSRRSQCAVTEPRQRKPSFVTMDTIFTKWIECMVPLYKPSTRHFLKATVTLLRRDFGKCQATAITTNDLQSYVSSVPFSAKTVANRITVFRSVWKSARSWGYVKSDPFIGLVLPKLTPPEPRCFSTNEVQRIISSAREPYRTLYRLAAETGMRAGELCALKWDDVDFEKNSICVSRSIYKWQETTPKTRSARRLISISDDVAAAVQSLGSPRTGTVFVSKWGRTLDPEKVVQRHLRPLLKKLGIPAGGLHAFRHFNATVMDSQSVPMKTRQVRLGHSSSQTTLQLYTHVLTEADRLAAENIAKCLLLPSQTAQDQDKPIIGRFVVWYSSTIPGTVQAVVRVGC